MRPLAFFLVIAACLAFTAPAVKSQSINAAITAELAKRETSLSNLVTAIEEVERTRCSRLAAWDAATSACDVPSCGNAFPAAKGFRCMHTLGSDEDTCGQGCRGLLRSDNKSTVLFAPQTSNDDKNVQGFLAIAKPIEEAQATERSSGRATSWMGYGSVFGASRWFPGSPRNRDASCSPYDPRLRSWYIAASSGPKDVVFVLDISLSMADADCSTCKTRLQLMKDATSALLDTLNFNDYFAVVTFNGLNSGNIITANGAATLLQATDANKESAKSKIRALAAIGDTHFQSGFDRAFAIFASSTETTSGCKRLILFSTDGDAGDKDTILGFITTKQSTNAMINNKAHIMTFTVSSSAAVQTPRDIACANQGIHQHIDNGVNPLNAMAQYYKFLAVGVEANESSAKPRWSEPYVDAFGMGRMTTVSRPVYDRSRAYPVFVGVAEVDVPLGILLALGTEDEVRLALSSRGKSCPIYNVTSCRLQILRQEAGYACPAPAPTVASCQAIVEEAATCSTGVSGGANAMLCDKLEWSRQVSSFGVKPYAEVVCCETCGLSAGAIAGIVVGSVAGVAIIGAIIWMVFFKSASAGAAAAAAAGASSSTTSTTVTAAFGGGSKVSNEAASAANVSPAPDILPPAQYGNPSAAPQYGNPLPPPQQQPVYGREVQPNFAFHQPPPAGYGESYPSASQYT